MASKPVDLTTFRKLLRKELQENKESRKPALHALIERITAYPDRKMEVKFRIGERVEPVKIVTPFLKLIFCAGKLSDGMYRRSVSRLVGVRESPPLGCYSYRVSGE